MATMHVTGRGGDQYEIRIGDHTVTVDQPVDNGGTDTGPTPTDLFVASLASCAAHYAGRFLRRHGLSSEGLEVACTFDMAPDRPARVGIIALDVHTGEAMPPELTGRLRAVVEHCTVKNSIARPPAVELSINAARPTAVQGGRTNR